MKVIRQTPDQLIIEDKPILKAIAIILLALMFFGLGLSMLDTAMIVGIVFILGGMLFGILMNMAVVHRTQIIFDNMSSTVELRRRSWSGFYKLHFNLAEVKEALVESKQLKNRFDRPTGHVVHRAVLIVTDGMEEGTHPTTVTFSTGDRAAETAKVINTWLSALDSRTAAS